MKYTVVIPTCDRASTLLHTLRTCVEQSYDDYEILVSDNKSSDNTQDIVSSFKDSRIRYISTDKRLSQSDSWEYALGSVNEGYVFVLGADDGLLPNAINNINELITILNTDALIWNASIYYWPSMNQYSNCLSIPLSNYLLRCPCSIVAKHISRLWLSYGWGISIYNGMVSTRLLKILKNRTGRIFSSISPDVYISMGLLSTVNEYYFSNRPFSVFGNSPNSIGYSWSNNVNNKSEVTELLLGDTKTCLNPMKNPIFPMFQNNITAGIVDGVLQANKYCFYDKYRIDKKKIYKHIIQEYANKDDQTCYINGTHEVLLHAEKNGYGNYIKTLIARNPWVPKLINVEYGPKGLSLRIDSKLFNVQNIYDASKVVDKILSKYRMPDKIKRYSLYFRICEMLARRMHNRWF